MTRTFTDIVDTLERQHGSLGVTFVGARRRYVVPAIPEDLEETLRTALKTGRAVNVTIEDRTGLIADVTWS